MSLDLINTFAIILIFIYLVLDSRSRDRIR